MTFVDPRGFLRIHCQVTGRVLVSATLTPRGWSRVYKKVRHCYRSLPQMFRRYIYNAFAGRAYYRGRDFKDLFRAVAGMSPSQVEGYAREQQAKEREKSLNNCFTNVVEEKATSSNGFVRFLQESDPLRLIIFHDWLHFTSHAAVEGGLNVAEHAAARSGLSRVSWFAKGLSKGSLFLSLAGLAIDAYMIPHAALEMDSGFASHCDTQ